MHGFKLISLKLDKNTLLGTVQYDFLEESDRSDVIYSTVIIGPNGTGKSNLFRIVIELFRELYSLSLGNGRTYTVDGEFRLVFAINGDLYEYANVLDARATRPSNYVPGKLLANLLKNNVTLAFDKALFPYGIVANSIMVTDKFPVLQKQKDFPVYHYLGVRHNAQNASTRSYVRKTVQFIIENKENHYFVSSLARITAFLGINPSVEIFYTTVNGNLFFSGKLRVDDFVAYFSKMQSDYKMKAYPPQKLTAYNRIQNDRDMINAICDFCNSMVAQARIIELRSKSSVKKLTYNIVVPEELRFLQLEGKMLDMLRSLGILSPPEISLSKAGTYSLQESSSGEYHLFSSIVGLMASVKSNTLVFLDEPEVSLHPNWQMKYLSLIRELFADPEYASSHVLVATHSHYMISDLTGDSSKIIGVKKVDELSLLAKGIKIELVDMPVDLNTYGWSAEEVLYRVFNVKTTRNFYVEQDLRELLHLISVNSNDVFLMQQLLARIEAIHFSAADPINLIIEKAKNYLDQ